MSRKSMSAFIPLAVLFLVGVQAAEKDEQKPTLRAGALPKEGVKLDGVLSEPAWAVADAIPNLTTIEPDEGGVPAGQTIVKVLANSKEIIIGAICHDPEPTKIVSFSKARDAELDDEDNITIVLDTFQDGRTGYVFAVNPSGARFDALVSPQGGEVNSDWDAVWEARTSRDNSSWSAEIRIPIQSLRFKPGLSSWGFNVQRRVQRLQETSRWSGIQRDYKIHQTSQAGILTDLPNFDLGLGLSIRPALVGRSEKTAGQRTHFTGDPSLDVTQRLGPNILTSLTVNTDFAETEVDARQTNLTRFEIFFPEKRTFFLEGANIFEFSSGLEEAMIPFFSRRIGLFFEQEGRPGVEIPIDVGGKVNGQLGNTSVGALVVRTRKVDHLGVPGATMGVVRLKQHILSESSVGLIATAGDQLGRPGSWLTGVDFTYRNSRFRGDKNLILSVWGLVNGRKDLQGNKSAFGFVVDYPNDRWNWTVASKRIGDGFDPSLGFVPRRGVHIWDGSLEFRPRPGWHLVRQMFHEVRYSVVNTLHSGLQSYAVTIKPFDWLLESGDRFEFSVTTAGDRLREEFDVFDRVVSHRIDWTLN
ncbi:MAG: carbohydrate binding family 9 domain-containing protein [candidate division NC10 bacterium]|nr:carbohydrate binding family 9 domain-containing protein [candidate division NC10 bacterium]